MAAGGDIMIRRDVRKGGVPQLDVIPAVAMQSRRAGTHEATGFRGQPPQAAWLAVVSVNRA
ncbi:hypothetical protein GCM10017083_55180 [Thalassobaculum fulvum]|uniref:Uncharacterized protein n=1 Tax=Thalassobaculum fulvum TaxID=1633335 RepID=A0A918XYB0_9PROT|nr:hypothetical protein GCM10017083_55180 [Thalassobaculum fulvum]